jgi:hypothetical protein
MIEKHYSHLDAEKAIEQLGGEKTRGLLSEWVAYVPFMSCDRTN